MNDAERIGESAKPFDVTKAGPLTLHARGISFAVDGMGQILRYPDGTPINGQQIEDVVNSSGRRLTNAEAAGKIIATQEFVSGVKATIDALRSAVPDKNLDTGPSS